MRRGVMLLIVTLVLAALSLSGAALLTLMKAEREATGTRGLTSLVKGVDRSAVEFLIAAVESTPEEREKFGGLYDNPQYFCGAPLLTLEEGGEDASRFTIVSPKFTDTKIEGVRYGLVDESTRLNLEAALAWENESPGAGRNALMKLPGMTAIAADSILDWIDPDERARSNGAEAKYYADKKLPYSPRNAVPVFLEEILLARGVTRSQLYGTDENFTYNVDKIEAEGSQALGGGLSGLGDLGALGGLGAGGLASMLGGSRNNSNAAVPWKELLTVFSAEKDVDPKGEARVDLNGSNLQFLYQELQSRVSADLAKFIVLYRQYGPQQPLQAQNGAQNGPGGNYGRGERRTGYAFGQGNNANNGAAGGRGGRQTGYAFGGARGGANAQNNNNNLAADGTPLTQGALGALQLDLQREPTTQLQTPLDIVGARVVVGNTVYNSPIPDNMNTANANALFQLLDYCSTSASTTIVGRVNVNAAPKAVLSAVPGLDDGLVQTIVTRRPDPSKALPSDFRHAAWLYTKGIVDLAKMRALYNKTTARGDVYRGQVVGFLDGSDEMARVEVVVDGTTIPPRQVFYKDLTSLGKGFSPAVLLGGMTTGAQQQSLDGTNANTPGSTQLLDIQNERTSGYTFGSDNSNSSDPFAAVDSQMNAANLDATPSLGGLDTLGSLGANASSNDALGGTTTDAGGALGALDATGGFGGGLDGGANTGANANGGGEESRRDRLLNALRSARDQRQARYQTNATPAPAEDANNAEEDLGGGSAGGFGGGFGGGNNAGNANAGGGNANGGFGGGNRGGGNAGGFGGGNRGGGDAGGFGGGNRGGGDAGGFGDDAAQGGGGNRGGGNRGGGGRGGRG